MCCATDNAGYLRVNYRTLTTVGIGGMLCRGLTLSCVHFVRVLMRELQEIDNKMVCGCVG